MSIGKGQTLNIDETATFLLRVITLELEAQILILILTVSCKLSECKSESMVWPCQKDHRQQRCNPHISGPSGPWLKLDMLSSNIINRRWDKVHACLSLRPAVNMLEVMSRMWTQLCERTQTVTHTETHVDMDSCRSSHRISWEIY